MSAISQTQGPVASFYGEECPQGMVQVAFVDCDPKNRHSDYGWKPVKSAFIDVFVDGDLFRIELGTFLAADGKLRRGLDIITPIGCEVRQDAFTVSIALEPQP